MLFSRRSILHLSSLFLLSLLSLRCKPSIRYLFFSSKGRKINPRKFANPYKDNEKALISIVSGEDVRSMIREAVSLIGGLEKIDIKGKLILVKPNVVTGDRNPTTTSPKVVKAVVEFLYDEGAQKVVVGDMSGLLTFSTAWNMETSGIKKAAEEAGAEVIYFENYDWLEVELSGTRYLERVYVSEWIYRADRIINLPVIKTHRNATYSICLKNFIGATHWKQRPYFIDRNHWEEVISEINQAYTPHLNIIDGTISMITGGPRRGTTAETNIILASGDRVAADVTGLGIIKSFGKCSMVVNRDVWDQRQIKRAIEMGLGVGRNKIELRSKALEGHNNDFKELIRKVEGYVKTTQ